MSSRSQTELDQTADKIKIGLKPHFDTSTLRLGPIDAHAYSQWLKQWAPETINPDRARDGYPRSKNNRPMYDWFQFGEEEDQTQDSFGISIWSNNILCGLARGKKLIYDNPHHGYLRCVEGAPFTHPLKGLTHSIAIAAAIHHCHDRNLSVLVADAPFSHGNIHDTYRRFNFSADPYSDGRQKNVQYYAIRTNTAEIDFSSMLKHGPSPLKLATDFCL